MLEYNTSNISTEFINLDSSFLEVTTFGYESKFAFFNTRSWGISFITEGCRAYITQRTNLLMSSNELAEYATIVALDIIHVLVSRDGFSGVININITYDDTPLESNVNKTLIRELSVKIGLITRLTKGLNFHESEKNDPILEGLVEKAANQYLVKDDLQGDTIFLSFENIVAFDEQFYNFYKNIIVMSHQFSSSAKGIPRRFLTAQDLQTMDISIKECTSIKFPITSDKDNFAIRNTFLSILSSDVVLILTTFDTDTLDFDKLEQSIITASVYNSKPVFIFNISDKNWYSTSKQQDRELVKVRGINLSMYKTIAYHVNRKIALPAFEYWERLIRRSELTKN